MTLVLLACTVSGLVVGHAIATALRSYGIGI